jgi:GTPase-associated system helical domain
MLNKTLEFLRIADLQPSDEKVRKRSESAKDLSDLIAKRENRSLLLSCVQGVAVGFDGALFTHDASSATEVYKVINERDKTLPSELKENAVELRAVAAIALGELITAHTAREALLAATALNSALYSRPSVNEQHLRVILETLSAAARKMLQASADTRRQRNSDALKAFEALEKPADESDLWDEIMPVMSSVIKEVRAQDEVNQEELETLWWLFAGYSELEGKALTDLTVLGAALASGIELAQRAILPPSASAAGMIKRATEAGRKPEDLALVKLQDAAGQWSNAMSDSFSTAEVPIGKLTASYPVLFPLVSTCQRLSADGSSAKIAKEVKAQTGLALTHQHTPTEWATQVFREKILQRMLVDTKGQ